MMNNNIIDDTPAMPEHFTHYILLLPIALSNLKNDNFWTLMGNMRYQKGRLGSMSCTVSLRMVLQMTISWNL